MPKSDEINLFQSKPDNSVSASSVDDIANIVDVARQIGAWLRSLHDLQPDQIGPPIAKTVIELDQKVTAAAETSSHQHTLLAPYDRHTPAELISKISAISETELCPTHGRPKLSDFSVSPDGNVTHFDIVESLAYRRSIWDLASLQLDITKHYGAGAVFEFYEGYGSDPNLVDLDSAFGFIAAAEALDVI